MPVVSKTLPYLSSSAIRRSPSSIVSWNAVRGPGAASCFDTLSGSSAGDSYDGLNRVTAKVLQPLFGRVSSGKSSLLNHIVQSDILRRIDSSEASCLLTYICVAREII
jgi:hypothetical protein